MQPNDQDNDQSSDEGHDLPNQLAHEQRERNHYTYPMLHFDIYAEIMGDTDFHIKKCDEEATMDCTDEKLRRTEDDDEPGILHFNEYGQFLTYDDG